MLSVSEAQYELVQPLMLPIWLELSGLLLLTFGLSAPRLVVAKPEPKKKAKSRKEKRLGPRKPPANNELPFAKKA
jgi:hypothetical protein